MFAVLVLASQMAIAGSKICLKDSFGDFYTLTGGRVDQKSYSVKAEAPGNCVVGGHAEVSLNSAGKYVLGITTAHDVNGTCFPVRWIAVGDQYLNSTGSYDELDNGTIDGAVGFSQVSCSSLPVYAPTEMMATTPNPDSPLVRKQ